MKEQNNKIEQEVKQTMTSLDRRKRLEGNPWLITRIQQRISESDSQTSSGQFSLGRLQPLVFVVLLFVNIWTAYTVFNNTNADLPTDEDYFEALAEEYSPNDDQSLNYYMEE